MAEMKVQIQDNFQTVEMAIHHFVANEKVRSQFARHGYTRERILEGQALYETAFKCYVRRSKLSNLQNEIHALATELEKKACIVRAIFREPDILAADLTSGDEFELEHEVRKAIEAEAMALRGLHTWLLQFVEVAITALDDGPEFLKKIGITSEMLDALESETSPHEGKQSAG